MTEALAAGRFRPEYRDAGVLAQALWASVHGVVALAITVGDAPWLNWRPTRVTNRLLADALLVGLVRPGDAALVDSRPLLAATTALSVVVTARIARRLERHYGLARATARVTPA